VFEKVLDDTSVEEVHGVQNETRYHPEDESLFASCRVIETTEAQLRPMRRIFL
jgi:hypothetical protein